MSPVLSKAMDRAGADGQEPVTRVQAESLFSEMESMKQKLLAMYPDLEQLQRGRQPHRTRGGREEKQTEKKLSKIGIDLPSQPGVDRADERHVNFAQIELPLPGSPDVVVKDDLLAPKKTRKLYALPPLQSGLANSNPSISSSETILGESQRSMQCLSDISERSASEESFQLPSKANTDCQIANGADGPRVLEGKPAARGDKADAGSSRSPSPPRRCRSKSPSRRLPSFASKSTHSASAGAHIKRAGSGGIKRQLQKIDNHTGTIAPTVTRAVSDRSWGSDASAEGLFVDEDWSSAAENAYGAFIHVGLNKGVREAVHQCGLMLVVSVLIQFVFAFELWRDLPPLQESNFCDIPWDLQVAAVGVFLTLMLNNLPGLARSAGLCLWCMESRTAGEDVVEELDANLANRWGVFALGVMTEFVTFVGVCSAGVQFILTAESVDMVIRSTVAIIFVQNVDEIVFEACCSNEMKENLVNTRYRDVHPSMVLKERISKHTWDALTRVYVRKIHLPFIVIICSAAVFGYRYTPRINCAAS